MDDQRGGKLWAIEKHTKIMLCYEGIECRIDGTYRHIHCQRGSETGTPFDSLTCRFCKLVPECNDFRMRLYRESRCTNKRSERDTGKGRRLDYLTQNELKNAARVTNANHRSTMRALWWERTKVATLSIRMRSLKEKLFESAESKDVFRFCKDVCEAHKQGKLQGKDAVWEFFKDIFHNLIHEKAGRRYSTSTKSLYEMIKLWGGPRLHNFISLNMDGPSISTTLRQVKKSLTYIPGEHEHIFEAVGKIYASYKAKHGIYGPIPVCLAEDETIVKKYVRWVAKSDTLVGFCGLKEEHQCQSHFLVTVGEGDAGYEIITNSFKNNVIGHYARVIIANPLHEKLPRLVVVVHPTCNKFNANFVYQQWEKVEFMWKKHVENNLGPIVGHSSDGDSRRRQLMLKDYSSTSGLRYQIPWEGWRLTGLYNGCNVTGLHDQDYIHNGKKLVNPLFSGRRELVLGNEYISFGHVRMVYHTFKVDDHKLKCEDIERMDRQNWGSAQRIASRHVQRCLKELRSTPSGKLERTLATETYLMIVADYIDIFMSRSLSLWERVRNASRVHHFFTLWLCWVQKQSHTNVNINFISREAYQDVRISCHFAVLLMRLFRDQYSNLPCVLHLTGSDVCENFFSKVGGMVGMERAYDFTDLLHAVGTLNRVVEEESNSQGLHFNKSHKKQENIWNKLHQETIQNTDILSQYDSISTDAKIVEALKNGLKDAQDILSTLGMKPENYTQCSWWVKPWTEDKDYSTFQIGDEVVDDSPPRFSNSIFQSSSSLVHNERELQIMESEWRHELDEILDSTDENVRKTIKPVVNLDGKDMFKACLVSQLNGNPTLSKDRLTKVRSGVYFRRDGNTLQKGVSIGFGIGSDCGVLFENNSIPPTERTARKGVPRSTKQGVTCGMWYIGRVQRIRKKDGNRVFDYHNDIDLLDRLEGIELQLCWYSRMKGQRVYKYDLTDHAFVQLESVIAIANLSYNAKNDTYKLEESDYKVFSDFVKNLNKVNFQNILRSLSLCISICWIIYK